MPLAAAPRLDHFRGDDVDDLAAGALDGGVIDEVLLGAVRADVALQRELARDDLFDGDLLFPAVATVFLLTARLQRVLRAAQRASRFGDRLSRHMESLALRSAASVFRRPSTVAGGPPPA